MNISYSTDRAVADSDLRRLYASVGWSLYLEKNRDLALLLPGCHLVLSAWDGDKLVGLIRTVGDGISIEYIQDILVDPGYQGCGIGSRLLEWVLEQSNDCYQVILTTDAGDTGIAARNLYEKLGLEQFATDNGYTGFYRPQESYK